MIKPVEVAKKMVSLESNARKRGLEFNLTYKAVRQVMLAKKCHYTGVPLQRTNFEGKDYLTFDRKDHKKGYVIGNVVACSLKANRKKGQLEERLKEFSSEDGAKILKKTIEYLGDIA